VRKYPLQSLLKRREHAVGQDAAQLKQAKERVDSSSAVHDEAKAEHHAAAERAQQQRTAEGQRVQRGAARASDLLQQAKHEAQIRDELRDLSAAEAKAAEQLEQAQQEQRDHRAKLQQSVAEANAASEHQRRWQRDERKRVTRREEESAHDAWQAGRSGQRGTGKS
jgi:hypothetical protein